MSDKVKARFARMARVGVIALMILGGITLTGQTDPNIFVNVTSKQDKAADRRYDPEYHKTLRDMLENRMFNGLKSAYPCIRYLDSSAAAQMIGVERMRQLLGGEGEGNLQAIANAVGANYLGSANVTVMGGTVVISGSMGTTANARMVGRAQATAPAGDEAAIEAAMSQFVSKLVASAGGDGPKCGGWRGEISAIASQHDKGKNPSGDPFTIDVDLKISCQIRPGDREPPCQLSYSYQMAGKDATISNSAGGTARCVASASIHKGIAKIRVGPCQIEGSSNVSVAGQSSSSKSQLSLGGWEHEFPVARDARELSGAKQVDKSTTINWSLTYR